MIKEYYDKAQELLGENRKLILFIVFVALLLDNMLLTTVGKLILGQKKFPWLNKGAGRKKNHQVEVAIFFMGISRYSMHKKIFWQH